MLPVLLYLIFVEGTDPFNIEEALLSPSNPYLAFSVLFFSFIGIYVIVWAWLRLVEQRPYYTLGFERKNALWQYLRGLLVGVSLLLFVTGVLALLGMSFHMYCM